MNPSELVSRIHSQRFIQFFLPTRKRKSPRPIQAPATANAIRKLRMGLRSNHAGSDASLSRNWRRYLRPVDHPLRTGRVRIRKELHPALRAKASRLAPVKWKKCLGSEIPNQ